MQIQFTPWRTFYARKKPDAIRRWLKSVGDASVAAFKNMGHYPPASTPSQYPAIRSGKLRASIGTRVTDSEMTIGSNMFYSIFLREGTRRMARRKMSDDALKEGMRSAGRLNHWVEWSRR